MIRFVIHSEERGVYLGDCIDRDFFALDDERGEWDTAIAFATEEFARREAAARFPEVPIMVAPVEVWTDANAIPIADKIVLYATIEECVAAGLPAWDVRRGDRAGWQGSRARVSVARRR